MIKTRWWKDLEGNIVVEWNGVLLVYPDFGWWILPIYLHVPTKYCIDTAGTLILS